MNIVSVRPDLRRWDDTYIVVAVPTMQRPGMAVTTPCSDQGNNHNHPNCTHPNHSIASCSLWAKRCNSEMEEQYGSLRNGIRAQAYHSDCVHILLRRQRMIAIVQGLFYRTCLLDQMYRRRGYHQERFAESARHCDAHDERLDHANHLQKVRLNTSIRWWL